MYDLLKTLVSELLLPLPVALGLLVVGLLLGVRGWHRHGGGVAGRCCFWPVGRR